MHETLQLIVEKARSEAADVNTRADWEQFKARLVGPQGSLTAVMKAMGLLSPADRPVMGKAINAVKLELESLFAKGLADVEAREIAQRLGPEIDPTLPSVAGHSGARHPLSQVRQRVYEIFRKLGFSVADGTEVETAWACFDALNVPLSHPSRADKDTYYLAPGSLFTATPTKPNDRLLLRAHTSSVQVRTMLGEKPPLKIVAAGRCFRRDTADATHSANFHQIETLCIDENVSVLDLKSTLDHFLRALLGPEIKIRLRPSFFPFTEPSFEVDIMAPNLGKLSNQWIEILGCGRVNPQVLKNVGLDPERWSGYAMGMGVERIAMIQYRIDDIRHFYQNDAQFLLSLA